MTLHDDIKRMGDLCREWQKGHVTQYTAGGQVMRLFLEREAEFLKLAEDRPAEAWLEWAE